MHPSDRTPSPSTPTAKSNDETKWVCIVSENLIPLMSLSCDYRRMNDIATYVLNDALGYTREPPFYRSASPR